MHRSVHFCATTGPLKVNTVTTVGSWFFMSEPCLPLVEHPMLMQTSLGGDSINWKILASCPGGPGYVPSSSCVESDSGECGQRMFRRFSSETQILHCCSSSGFLHQ